MVEQECQRWAAKGINIRYESRENRTGYKAGALKEGLKRSYVKHCEYVAIFDVDFRLEPDYLRRAIPYLVQNSDIALVQARWRFDALYLDFTYLIGISQKYSREHQEGQTAIENLLQETIEKHQVELVEQKDYYINALAAAKEAKELTEARANNEAKAELESRLRDAQEHETMLVQALEELRQTLSRIKQQVFALFIEIVGLNLANLQNDVLRLCVVAL
ncbi:hypothetical protein WN944_010777 [Citrus x changshan-huyou]|uniref:Glycosyltransferase 2-like domain-containing protein n=1 Tax=Citrus x changshan-huyou TaxID=2935761 RepID=A0AAP0QXF3_9ROSI